MIQVRQLNTTTYRTLPWKNHRGTTSEIYIFPEGLSFHTDPYLWRVSSARISSSGSFSLFPGYDRTILVIDGKGAELNHQQADAPKSLTPLEPYQFKGEWDTTIEIGDQSVRDFNLMVRRGKTSSSLEVLKLGEKPVEFTSRERNLLIYCISGNAAVKGAKTGEFKISKKDSLLYLLDENEHENCSLKALEPGTSVIVVQVSVLPSSA